MSWASFGRCASVGDRRTSMISKTALEGGVMAFQQFCWFHDPDAERLRWTQVKAE